MTHQSRIQGIYSQLGLILFSLLASLNGLDRASLFHWVSLLSIAASIAITIGALLHLTQRALARVLITFGLFSALGLAITSPPSSPSLALLLLVSIGSAIAAIWINWDKTLSNKPTYLKPRENSQIEAKACRARTSILSTLVFWFLSLGVESLSGPVSTAAIAASIIFSTSWYLSWLRIEKRSQKNNFVQFGISLIVSAILTWITWKDVQTALNTSMIFMAVALYTLQKQINTDEMTTAENRPFWMHPERLLILTFLGLSLAGALLLATPLASSTQDSIDFVDAAFTAISAVCVTGLTVLDTPIDFSTQGQFFILLLIQLGGLGIMTFSTATLILLGKRMSLEHEGVMTRMLGGEHRGEIVKALQRVLIVTFTTEIIGSLILTLAFIQAGDSVGQALWRGVFTSISAFCNAGFSLQSNSLIPYAENPLILHTISVLIIIGGISPGAVWVLPKLLKRKKISLHYKLLFSTTIALLAIGFTGVLAFDWDHSLGHLSTFDRIHNAWIHSVSARTAGFNSIQTDQMHNASKILALFLMIIGGSPGSTAGGLKTTTFAVLVLAVIAAFRRQPQVTVFGRRLPHELIYRAAAILIATGSIGFFGLIALHLTQEISLEIALFEMISALGTVGLSIGGTTQLDSIGKVIVMILMFAGRVGPLTLFLFLSSTQSKSPLKVPEEQIGIS